jgi:hypothetical protein
MVRPAQRRTGEWSGPADGPVGPRGRGGLVVGEERIASNTGLAAMPGNGFVPAIAGGLPRDSVVSVAALITLGKTDLEPAVGQLPASLMHEADRGLRRVLGHPGPVEAGGVPGC